MNTVATEMQGLTLAEYFRLAGVESAVPYAGDITIPPQMYPMKHQVHDLNNALINGSWGLFHEPGVGKTLPAQAWALYWAAHGYKVLAVMPPILLDQFRYALWDTFEGSKAQFSFHSLVEGPLPARFSKRRVQEIKAAMSHNKPLPKGLKLPQTVMEYVFRMSKAAVVPFTARQIKAIRESDERPEEVAAILGCSPHAIRNIRNRRSREDLFFEWKENDSWPDILIMSYQMFYRVNLTLNGVYNVLIADEAHALCHPNSGTHQKVRNFLAADGGTAFLPMTGTPIPNLPSDAYGLIKLLNPGAYRDFAEFERLHCHKEPIEVPNKKEGGRRTVLVTVGFRNLDTIHRALFAKSSRLTKEQVFTLDKPVINEVRVSMSDQHQALYNKLVRERVLEVRGETIDAVEASSLRQKCLRIVTCPDQFTEDAIKENNVRLMLEELLDEIGCAHNEKVAMFGIYNRSIEAMAEWFTDLNPAVVYGKSNTKKEVNKFLTDDTCRLMIAHPKSGGVGLNLQGVCRYVIFAEPTSVPGDFIQASERVYRKGQTKVVTFYILRVYHSIWPQMVDNMRGKMKQTQKITKDKTQMLDELLGKAYE